MSTQPANYYICPLPSSAGGALVNLRQVAASPHTGLPALELTNKVPDNATGLTIPFKVLVRSRTFSADDIVIFPQYYRRVFIHMKDRHPKYATAVSRRHVVALPGARRPMELGFRTDQIMQVSSAKI
jgi:hypothetical protein